MAKHVTVRDLRNAGGRVLRRVARGEAVIITMDGTPVAELRPVRATGLASAVLIQRRRALPPVDPDRLRQDLDRAIDSST